VTHLLLGISEKLIPQEIEAVPDPKQLLINLAAKSKNRKIREAIVPPAGKTVTMGPDYNDKLKEFFNNFWQAERAAQYSPSLQRTIDTITTFEPI
jgi:hypothetical protein